MRWKWPRLNLSLHCRGGGEPAPGKGLLAKILSPLGRLPPSDWSELPSAALARKNEDKVYFSADINATWAAQWLAFVWPQNPAAAYVRGVAKIIHRIDENSSGWEPGHGFLHGLFQRNRPWGEAGHLILAIGLVGKDADVRGLAIDALIEGIGGRLFDPDLFAGVVARLCDGEWVKLNRLSDALMQAAQTSSTHAQVIGRSLRKLVPGFDFKRQNAANLLEVLVEAQAATGDPLDRTTLDALASIGGSGKAAKLARQLTAMSPTA
jgi:hypothetical protein